MTLRVRMADGVINLSADIIFRTFSRETARVFFLNPQPPETKVVHCRFSMFHPTDEDGAYAARMDEWVAWETVERAAPRGEG
jgi:hypothetical protein